MKVSPDTSGSRSTSVAATSRNTSLPPAASMVAILSDHVKVSRQDRHDFVDCSLRLTDRYLSVMYSRENNNTTENEPQVFAFSIADIIGCHLLDSENVKVFSPLIKHSRSSPNEKSSFWSVIAYPFKHPPKLSFSRTSKRVRKVLTFAIDMFTATENREAATRWVRTLMWLKEDKMAVITWLSERLAIPEIPKPKRLLVMVNPAAGPGKSGIIFEDRVAPLLAEAGIAVTLFVSSSSGSARDYVRTADLKRHFDGIVIISGDGLIFEVVNGLMRRDDWDEAIRMPLGIIPGGSGNGLAFSINFAVGAHRVQRFPDHLRDSEFSLGNPILASTLNVIHGRRTPLDLVEVTTRSDTFYSFLSVGWGLLADMDIESERLRFMGGFRFTVYGIIRSFVLKKYRGRLSFLPVPAFAKDSNPFSGQTKIQETECQLVGGSQAVRLPALAVPVPDDWIVVDGDFVMVYTAHTSHMSSDCFLAPSARLDDGVIWLLYLKGDVSKSQVLTFLISLESGKHIELPYVNLVPVRAFRLEPLDDVGVLTVDGERVKTGAVQARVLPSIANVMSR